ncbi:MAG: matrixin family metalloprotease [Gemmatimonadaceae bacterium]|nr:matrixin family metalloprotease [Gemmatimonadaceae bacterium]
MKRSDLIPVMLLLPVLGFVAVQAMHTRAITATTQAASLAPASRVHKKHSASHTMESAASIGESSDDNSTLDYDVDMKTRDVIDIRRRIQLGENGTYIGEILGERDSALARWPERLTTPVRVWVGSGPEIAGWDPSYPERVRDAFDQWANLGIPVKFTFVRDSTDADVHVSWIDHFDSPISGKTIWARDGKWWIVTANITLALHHNAGELLDSKAVRAIALHEVGHLLGLDHTADTANIMTARVRVRDLSEADRATMKLLYSLPPGSVK